MKKLVVHSQLTGCQARDGKKLRGQLILVCSGFLPAGSDLSWIQNVLVPVGSFALLLVFLILLMRMER